MTDLLANPAIQSGAIPFAMSIVVALALGVTGTSSARYAGIAVLAGFVAGYVVALGLPPLEPKSSGQKIFFIALLGGVAGLILQTFPSHSGRRVLGGLIISILAIGWLGWRKLVGDVSPDHLSMALILIGTAIALSATECESEDAIEKIVPLLITSIAFAGVAFFGASASIAQNAGALAAALGGVLILNWPTRRFGLDAVVRITTVVILVALATQMALFTNTPDWIPAILLPALFVDRLANWLIPVESPSAHVVRPILITLLAAIPAAAALMSAHASSPGLSGGY